MDNRKLEIDIKGVTGSGKTFITAILAEALEKYGIDYNVSSIDGFTLKDRDFVKEKGVELRKKGLLVQINEVQLNREGVKS